MWKDYGPLLGLIYVHASYGAMFLIASVVLTQGMNLYLYVVFRLALASIFLSLFAYFLESDQRSKLTLRNLRKLSVLALLGVTLSDSLYSAGLSLTSTTFASTMSNVNPVITFAMAVAFRLEKLDLWTWRGQAKVWGTSLCVAGAMIMTLFKGPDIIPLKKEPTALILPVDLSSASESPLDTSWILGALLLAGGACAWSGFLIYQTRIAEDCPPQLTSAAVMCWMGTLQLAIVAFLFGKPGAWRLNWDLQLLAMSYSAIFCSALGLFVQMWCVKEKGPVFVTVFSPLSTVLVAILEPFLLHIPLHWGSLGGMVMVIGGLYCVLWGKGMEEEDKSIATGANTVSFEPDGSTTEPLLTQNRGEQIEILSFN